jgi:hypothetical protein
MSHETETELITRARDAVTSSNWVIGECAALWTTRHAKGRTDADFGKLIGISGDRVGTCRRVFDRWGQPDNTFRGAAETGRLHWTHLADAVGWDDAEQMLTYALEQYDADDEKPCPVDLMRVHRRLNRGEDLTVPEGDQRAFPSESLPAVAVEEPHVAHKPSANPERAVIATSAVAPVAAAATADSVTPAKVERATEAGYSPYRATAGGAAKQTPPKPSPTKSTSSAGPSWISAALASITATTRNLNKQGFGALAADHLDAMADQCRRGEPITGLDAVTVAAFVAQQRARHDV